MVGTERIRTGVKHLQVKNAKLMDDMESGICSEGNDENAKDGTTLPRNAVSNRSYQHNQ